MVQGMFGLERGIKVESQRQINKVKTESVEAEEVSDCVTIYIFFGIIMISVIYYGDCECQPMQTPKMTFHSHPSFPRHHHHPFYSLTNY